LAKDLSRQALIQKYLPLVVVLGFVLLMLFLRFYVFAKKK
jgi:vesicle transport protein SEC22